MPSLDKAPGSRGRTELLFAGEHVRLTTSGGFKVKNQAKDCVFQQEAETEDGTPRQVPFDVPVSAGPLTALQVSRDGARIAMVFGGRLHVGMVEPTGSGWRIRDLARVSRELVGVVDVAWESGTSLVALGAFGAEQQPFPASVAVDGSAFAVLPLVGAVAVEVAAAPRRPLVVAADVDGERQLFRDNGTLIRQLDLPEGGSAPFYPG